MADDFLEPLPDFLTEEDFPFPPFLAFSAGGLPPPDGAAPPGEGGGAGGGGGFGSVTNSRSTVCPVPPVLAAEIVIV